MLAALDILDRLQARPAALWVRSRLRHAGVDSIPRGPRQSTRTHPAGLTARQAEVLALMREGLANGDIAQRLFISKKTVEHHVSAVLAKLGVATRAEAITLGRQDGGGVSPT
jgi:DNA-binding NarL/FixJ family response regulator